MFNKLKNLFSGNSKEIPSPDTLPPDLISHIDLTIPRAAYFDREVAESVSCPACQTPLESAHAPFMVALTDQRGHTIDGFVMGHEAVGRFCPSCPAVIIDMSAVEDQLDAIKDTLDDLPDDYGIAVVGLLDLEKMAELEEQGEEIEEYPIIPFLAPKGSSKKRPSGRKKTKTKRKKRR